MARILKTKLGKVFAALAVIIFALVVWAFWLEPASITVRHVRLEIPSWHAEHRDMKIAVLTDLHVGSPHMGLDKLRRIVGHTNDERPDLVLLLGDYVIGGPKDKDGERGGVVGGTFIYAILIRST